MNALRIADFIGRSADERLGGERTNSTHAPANKLKTRYEITFSDFRQLLSYPPYRSEVAPLIGEWFGYEVVPTDGSFALRDRTGVEVSPEMVHKAIQADRDKQYRIYQIAMSLWR